MSSTANSSNHKAYWIKETTYGVTPASGNLTEIPQYEMSVEANPSYVEDQTYRGTRFETCRQLGRIEYTGSAGANFEWQAHDEFMSAVFCSDWVTGTADASTPPVGTDRLSMGNTVKSYTIFRIFEDFTGTKKVEKTTGVQFSSISFESGDQGALKLNYGIMARQTEALPAVPAGLTLVAAGADCNLMSFLGGDIKEGGASIADLTSINFKIDNQLAANYALNQRYVSQGALKSPVCEGEATFFISDLIRYESALNDQKTTLELPLNDKAGNNYVFKFNRVSYAPTGIKTSGSEDIFDERPFKLLAVDAINTPIVLERTPV